MTQKYYKIETMKKYNKEWLDAQKKAELHHGMRDNHFFIDEESGYVVQFVNCKEADEFYEFVENIKDYEFDILCNNFVKETKKEKPNRYKMFLALTIFDEMDNYNLGTPIMMERLLEVRESTHGISYKI